MNVYRALFSRVHREGVPFVLIAFVVAALGFLFVSDMLGWIALIVTAVFVYFFRDPERVVPERDGILVSPADGLVSILDEAAPPGELEMGPEPRARIAIFLSVIDVHVTRAPAAGKVGELAYVAGGFANAMDAEASAANERQLLRLDLADGRDLAVAQIAGKIARRIVCEVEEGETLERGARFGIIRFGSRVDVYLPEGMVPRVAVGQRMTGGESVIAEAAA